METGFMLLVVEELCELNLLNFLFIGLSNFGISKLEIPLWFCWILILFYFRPTEIWSLTDEEEISAIHIVEPTLDSYKDYPEIFLVDSDFCTRN